MPSVLTPERLEKSADVVDESEMDAFKKAVQKHKGPSEYGKSSGCGGSGTGGGHASGSGSGSAGASAPTGPRPITKKLDPFEDADNPSALQARPFLPPHPNATISRDDKRHLRWVIFYLSTISDTIPKHVARRSTLSKRLGF